jgi:hypothetical protein
LGLHGLVYPGDDAIDPGTEFEGTTIGVTRFTNSQG